MSDLAKVIHGIDEPAPRVLRSELIGDAANAAWRRVAIYTMLRLLQNGRFG